MIDNYDSFTFNIVQYFGQLGEYVQVYRNDKISLSEIEALAPERLVISPGPCSPEEAGISVSAINHFAGKIPILGVCLGHQSIGYAFGGKVLRSSSLMHGKTSLINIIVESTIGSIHLPFAVPCHGPTDPARHRSRAERASPGPGP